MPNVLLIEDDRLLGIRSQRKEGIIEQIRQLDLGHIIGVFFHSGVI